MGLAREHVGCQVMALCQIERERREIAGNPRKETAEIRVIFHELGFSRDEQDLAVRRISADPDRWLRFMVQEEIGINPSSIDNPWEIGLVSAGAFLLGALPAVLPFLLLPSAVTALPVSAAVVLAFLFVIGIVSTRVTKAHWLLGGVETLVSIPVYSSHIFMDDAELARHGVTPGMIRISVGVEHVDDLIADFDQALSTI